jgi:hypothetical protein
LNKITPDDAKQCAEYNDKRQPYPAARMQHFVQFLYRIRRISFDFAEAERAQLPRCIRGRLG